MSEKLNCWEYQNCGREPGGVMSETLGICPVPMSMRFDGDNSGRAGGRVCWSISVSNDSPSLKSCQDKACSECAFFKRVRFEEEPIVLPNRRLTILSPIAPTSEIA